MNDNSLHMLYGYVLRYVTLVIFLSADFCRKMSKVQFFVVEESLNSCGKLLCCKVVTQFSQSLY